MGIKNLNNFLKNYCIFEEKHISKYKGKRLGIDTSLFLYRFYYNGNNILESFLKQILLLVKNDIIPLYIFEGESPSEKKEELLLREKRKLKNIERLNELENIYQKNEDIIKEIELLKRKIVIFNHQDIKNLKEIFLCFGIPYINFQEEADGLLSHLVKINLIDGVISEDSDFLVHGCPLLLRNFSLYEEKVKEYRLNYILNNIKLNEDEFKNLCIICGCDYIKKINNNTIQEIYDKKQYNIEYIKQIGDYYNKFINVKKIFTRDYYKYELHNMKPHFVDYIIAKYKLYKYQTTIKSSLLKKTSILTLFPV